VRSPDHLAVRDDDLAEMAAALEMPVSFFCLGEWKVARADVRRPVLKSLAMRISSDFRRKLLHGLAAVVEDPVATEHEKANTKALRACLQHRLAEAGSHAGDSTDNVFRLGRWAKEIRKPTSPTSPNGDDAQRLGKALRRG